MKVLKFHHQFINSLISNYKTNTWRLFDEKNLSINDELILVDRSTQKPFARAKILSVKETTFRNLTAEDKRGHEEYKDEEEMLKIYENYHKTHLTLDSPLKVIDFEILKKYSVIITTHKEAKTLGEAIQAILDDIRNSLEFVISEECEILVIGPDQETEEIVKNFSVPLFSDGRIKQARSIRYLKDKGIGKPAALNIAFKHAGGQILILTDGDVVIKKGAIKNLIRHFENEKIGAVSGHPISLNSRKNMFGYWSHFLTNAADFVRKTKTRNGEYITCSGYLYAIRKEAIRNSRRFVIGKENATGVLEIPENTLVDDEVISRLISAKGYKIIYEPTAEIFVKYPDNFSDWLKQKIRATGGYSQNLQFSISNFQTNSKFQILNSKQRMRGFVEEVGGGIKLFFTYQKNFREFWWTILLYFARLYLWFLIFWRIKILKKTSWPRIESTKIL